MLITSWSSADVAPGLVLLTAEVSVTYMNVEAADALINWASALPEARFCLLEQLLPDGIDHPFSKTMMAHFDKLQTPLGAVKKYPTTLDQERRFRDLGWGQVRIQNLWKLWSNSIFVTSEKRKALDLIEPFDEWEEFALFGCHYFLLVADNIQWSSPIGNDRPRSLTRSLESAVGEGDIKIFYSENPKTHAYRRFGAPLPLKGPARNAQRLGVFGGTGNATRMNSCDVYSSDQIRSSGSELPFPSTVPSSRMCHTITDLGETGALLVGGRTSPDNAFKDCWLYHKWLNIWEKVDDLPHPLYRHQAVALSQGRVLISTGRIDSHTISPQFLIWSRKTGWKKCVVGSEDAPKKCYGASLCVVDAPTHAGDSVSGILAGGMSEDTEIQQETWRWRLKGFASTDPTLTFRKDTTDNDLSLLYRFGAETVSWNRQIMVIGGVAKDHLLKMGEDVCVLKATSGTLSLTPARLQNNGEVPRSLFVGSSTACIEGSLLITGGSAVCFSFGTFYNKGCLTLSRDGSPDTSEGLPKWQYLATVEAEPTQGPKSQMPAVSSDHVLVSIPRVRVHSPADFSQILDSSRPVVIEGLNIGSCTSLWTNEYLKSRVGEDREIVVHEAKTTSMDFKSKNFSYTPKKFGGFLDQIEAGETLYLRSLSADKPADLPTNIATDFPSIAADFQLPPELVAVTDNMHSSPLRISGPVNMWLHYDVMANVLCQIRGSKRMLLFPPTDATHLEFEAGSSSSSVNAFERLKQNTLGQAHPHQAVLQAGDVLFLPPLWLHTASPTSMTSIGVNVFFRNLTHGYAAGKDTYGNRDVAAYEKGRLDIVKIVKSFDNLPADVRSFYLQRLADEFMQKAT